jgi:hypothetical protein
LVVLHVVGEEVEEATMEEEVEPVVALVVVVQVLLQAKFYQVKEMCKEEMVLSTSNGFHPSQQ